MSHGEERVFAYVTHSAVQLYAANGWEFSANLGPPHCFYSVLMEWVGDGDPVFPTKELNRGQQIQSETDRQDGRDNH